MAGHRDNGRSPYRGSAHVNLTVLTQKSPSWFVAMGGWRTVVESIASHTLFLLVYLFTKQAPISAAMAVGAVLVLTIIRVRAGGNYWSAAIALLVVGVSALLAGKTVHGIGYYLPHMLIGTAICGVFLLSILVRWPAVGLIVNLLFRTAGGDRLAWRHDRAQLRRYNLCTAVFLAKDAILIAIKIPFYVAGQVIPLGIITTLTGPPGMALCAYLSWRILRLASPANGAIQPEGTLS